MKAILVPFDLTQPMREVEGESIQAIAQEHWDHPGSKWCERVNTKTMHNYNFMMVVDEVGHDLELPANIRAIMISQYPGPAIVGDVLLATEYNPGDGPHFVDVHDGVMPLLEESGIDDMAKMMVGLLREQCPDCKKGNKKHSH